MSVILEQVLDQIAEALITSKYVDPQLVSENQKTIREGIITTGRANSDKLILFEKDIKANIEDLSTTFVDGDTYAGQSLVSLIDQVGDETIEIVVGEDGRIILSTPGGSSFPAGIEIQNLLSDDENNPLNVSQFVNIDLLASDIDPAQANEFLDTTIFELLPNQQPRQERINNFFSEWEALKGDIPLFDVDPNDGWVDDDFSYTDYSATHDISFAQSPPDDYTGNIIEEQESFITRLDDSTNDLNSGKTIQSLRTQINEYLQDIDEVPAPLEDDRPEYVNKSDGYLKFRHLNQGIIVRNVNQKYIEGLNAETLDYLDTGFTVTMWVRFLDKLSEGTLFNFGNPLRQFKPFGFTLDTFVLHENRVDNVDYAFPEGGFTEVVGPNNPNGTLFAGSDTERFVRLILREGGTDAYGKLRDSHVGGIEYPRKDGIPMQGWDSYNYITDQEDTSLAPNDINTTSGDNQFKNSLGLFHHLKIPTDLNEWYFIVATYDPSVDEDNSFGKTFCPDTPYSADCDYNPDFWRGNIGQDSYYTNHSFIGNKCKVEMISRSDLLRARGYKVGEE